jgi:Aminomethyltransferase folate-binding domain
VRDIPSCGADQWRGAPRTGGTIPTCGKFSTMADTRTPREAPAHAPQDAPEDVADQVPEGANDGLSRSPLQERHVALGAKFAEFGGWSMPVEYEAGILKEHHAVREAVGVFDVSHLGKLMVKGTGAAAYVNQTLTNDLDRIGAGQAQYTLCCDAETGGIVDDLIAYRHSDERVLLMPNAANAAVVHDLLAADAPEGVTVVDSCTGFGFRRIVDRGRLARRARLHGIRRG